MLNPMTFFRDVADELPERDRRPRWDVQGLRALAVIAVVVDHLTGWPGGGFVGVDIFFVISGFLITGLLVREHERTDRISFLGFYKRRLKRIMPAALIVIAATVVASHLVFNTVRAASIQRDAIAAALFGSNWRFMAQATDYFAASGPVSPLQHYWSLSIEEQFYFVWPWLMLGIYALLLRGNRTRRAAHIVIAVVMAVIIVASFAWAVTETGSNPTRAYFDTFARIWELGVGALLAVAVPLLARLPRAIRPVLSWAGVAAMIASLWVIDGDTGFPAPAAALPVLGAALVIIGGTYAERGQQQRFLWPLTNRGSNYVGDVSYSLYLWHFPIIIIGTELIGDTTRDKVTLVVTMALAAMFSYHLVENPLRRNPWSWRELERRFEFPDAGVRAWQFGVVTLAILCTSALVVAVLHPAEAPRGIEVTVAAPTAGAGGGAVPAETAALQTQIARALAATEWPTLKPSIEDAIDSPQAPPDVAPCGAYPLVDRTKCTWGPKTATRTAVVVGDSVGMTWINPIRTALSDWRVAGYATFGCPFTKTLISNPDPDITATCDERKADAVAAINDIKPDVVFVANSYVDKAPPGSDKALTQDQLHDSTLALVNEFAASVGSKVVFLAAPPGDADISECYTPRSSPADCAGTVTNTWDDFAATDERLAGDTKGVFVDSTPMFCADDFCPAFVETTVTKLDHNHMTIEYGEKIAAVLRAQLAEAGAI